MSIGANKAVVRRFIEEAFVGGDMAVADELLADSVSNENPLIYHQPGTGKEGIKAGIALIHQGFPDISVSMQELLAEDERVMASFILAGTNTGPYRGHTQPTGKHATMRTILVFRVVDRQITEIGGVADRMEFLTQLGMLPDIG